MRLIDADKLLQETWKVETKDMFHMTEIVDVVSAIDIKEAPTVKAIPIEWIEKWLKEQERIVLISPPYYNQVRVPKMLEDWENNEWQQ